MYVFGYDSNKENIILRFDAISEEWESLLVQGRFNVNEYSYGLYIDEDLILIVAGRKMNNSNEETKGGDEASGECLLYSVKRNQFYQFPALNQSRFWHSCIAFKDNVYVFGGNSKGLDEFTVSSLTSSVEKINYSNLKEANKVAQLQFSVIMTLKWDEIEPFNKIRCNHNSIVYKEEIFLFGGITVGGKICRDVEKYNPAQNRWLHLDWKLPFYIHSTSITALNEHEIIFIGGKNYAGIIPSIYQINFSTMKYQSKGAFSFRVSPKILHHSAHIYIFGGDKEMSCEKMNPVEFVSYASSESYTGFINSDLINLPCSFGNVDIGDDKVQREEHEIFSPGIEESNCVNDLERFFLFGTPNHPFLLEFNGKTENVNFHPISLFYRFFYFGCACRVNENTIITFGGITPPKRKASRSVQILSLRKFHSQKLEKMSQSRCKFESIMIDNKIYVIGGIYFENENEIYLKSCECFDLATFKWTQIASLNKPRYNCSLYSNKNCIYALGGSDGQKFYETVEKYSIEDDVWSIVPLSEQGLENPLMCPAITMFSDEELLIVGGTTLEKPSTNLTLLNITDNSKKKVGFLKEGRYGHKIWRFSDYIFIIGGSKSNIGVECIRNSTFENMTSLFPNFDESLGKYYRDKMLNGVLGA